MKPFTPSRNTHGWRACVALLDGDMLATELGATLGIGDNHMQSALRHILRHELIRSYKSRTNRLCYGLTEEGRARFIAFANPPDESADEATPDMPVLQRRVCARSADPIPVMRDAISLAWFG